MLTAEINLLAVLVCGVLYMAIGALWYSPLLFANAWMKLIGKTEAELKEGFNPVVYLYSFILSLLMAYFLAHFAAALGANSVLSGIRLGFYAWLGISVPTMLPSYFFERRPFKLFAINSFYPLVTLMLMGIILALWK